MNILFWNIKGNNLQKHIEQCLIENNVDVAVFAEYKGTDFLLLSKELNYSYQYIETIGGCDKVALLVSKSVNATIKREQSRYALYKIEANGANIRLVLSMPANTNDHFPDLPSQGVFPFDPVHLQSQKTY